MSRKATFAVVTVCVASVIVYHWLPTWPGRITFQAETNSPAYVVGSPDGRVVASVSLHEKTIVLWDLATGKRLATLRGVRGFGRPVVFSPDARILATGGASQLVHLWNVSTGTRRASLGGHTDAVHGLAFSSDGKMLASGSYDKTVKLW